MIDVTPFLHRLLNAEDDIMPILAQFSDALEEAGHEHAALIRTARVESAPGSSIIFAACLGKGRHMHLGRRLAELDLARLIIDLWWDGCDVCFGRGEAGFRNDPCPNCNGLGWLTPKQSLAIAIERLDKIIEASL